jgi:septal ring factor EnvC (AmiA/AmiB activator)
MTRPTATMSPVVQQVVLCVLAAVLLSEAGCVSRRTYESVKAEMLEQTQALESVREDVRELDREIAGLQASNRREDAAVSELRATIQREEEQLPIMRQRAEDTLASLKTQVATLMNQSWHLARKIVDIRQESVSLQTKVARYKEEMEQAFSPVMAASERDKSAITEAVASEAPVSSVASTQDVESTQVAQAVPPPQSLAPIKPSVSAPSVNVDPPQANDSWIGIITSWFAKIWNWLFG